MRGILIIGMVVGLLILGILVMKNMGVDDSKGVTQTQAKTYTDQAKSVADGATERMNDLRDQMSQSE